MTAASDQSEPSMLERVFARLDERGVQWTLLRGGADLRSLERDVDLLVAAADLAAFGDVVAELGGVPLPGWLQSWHRFYWFPPSTLSRPGLMLDVVTALIYGRNGRLPTDLAAGCLERRVKRAAAYEMAPTDTFWTVMLHCLLDKGDVKERRAAELRLALTDLVRPSDGESIAADVCPEGWSPDRLVECVRQGDWDDLAEVANIVRSGGPSTANAGKRQTPAPKSAKMLGVRRHLPQRNSVGGNVVKMAYAAAWRLSRRTRSRLGEPARKRGSSMSETRTTMDPGQEGMPAKRRTPVRIALSGLDGSGKSRQTAALAESLAERYQTELVWVPFDIWPGSMLKLLPTVVRVHLGPRGRMDADAQLTAAQLADRAAAEQARAAQPAQSTRSPLRLFWWVVATLAAVSAGTSLRRRMNRMSSEVVVIDRYRLDTIVKLQTWYPTVSPNWLASIVLRLAPAPDVECLLRVEGAEAYARKPEQYNAVQLTQQAQRYDKLVASVPGAVSVDGQALPDDVTLALRRLADAALHAR